MNNIILKFINNFKKLHPSELEDAFSNGNCYHFALILHELFKEDTEIIYIPIYNHYCIKDKNNIYYDIKGIINNKEYLDLAVSWEEYKLQDELETKNLIKYCIYKEAVEE